VERRFILKVGFNMENGGFDYIGAGFIRLTPNESIAHAALYNADRRSTKASLDFLKLKKGVVGK
jgi:hypothetical protein